MSLKTRHSFSRRVECLIEVGEMKEMRMDNKNNQKNESFECVSSACVLDDGRVCTNQHDFSCAEDGLLWHFTKVDALQSILQNGFRMTHSSCLSDKLDGALRNQVQEIYVDLYSRLYEIKKNCKLSGDEKKSAHAIIGRDVITPSFITCFALNPKFEDMWERYCSDGGIAIGVKVKYLIDKCRDKSEGEYLLKRCDYSNWIELAEDIGKYKHKVRDQLKNVKVREELKKLESEVMPAVEKNSKEVLFAKRELFSFEREVRLVRLIVGKDDALLNKCRGELGQFKDKVYLNLKLNGKPKDWIGSILVSPYGGVNDNFARVSVIARIHGMSSIVAKGVLPSYAVNV